MTRRPIWLLITVPLMILLGAASIGDTRSASRALAATAPTPTPRRAHVCQQGQSALREDKRGFIHMPSQAL